VAVVESLPCLLIAILAAVRISKMYTFEKLHQRPLGPTSNLVYTTINFVHIPARHTTQRRSNRAAINYETIGGITTASIPPLPYPPRSACPSSIFSHGRSATCKTELPPNSTSPPRRFHEKSESTPDPPSGALSLPSIPHSAVVVSLTGHVDEEDPSESPSFAQSTSVVLQADKENHVETNANLHQSVVRGDGMCITCYML
jgi:hypothetical protein